MFIHYKKGCSFSTYQCDFCGIRYGKSNNGQIGISLQKNDFCEVCEWIHCKHKQRKVMGTYRAGYCPNMTGRLRALWRRPKKSIKRIHHTVSSPAYKEVKLRPINVSRAERFQIS